jgi:phosphatidylserine decarboxylase
MATRQGGPIAAPGYPFIAAGLLVMFLGWLMISTGLTLLGLSAACFFTYFFRDPERPVPVDPDVIASPADGKVIRVDRETMPEGAEDVELFDGAPVQRIAIFMNVFDVHVNRSPLSGTVTGVAHHSGSFLAAFKNEAAAANERHVLAIDGGQGRRALVVQIAGLLARRIINAVKAGDQLARGQRFGMICFGSRVDLYLPAGARVTVKVGDRVKAGESVVGKWT